jgi:glutathione S-transferase
MSDALIFYTNPMSRGRIVRFTAADLYLGSQIGFGLQFGTIEKRPAFEPYWQRISTRPAALRARAIDDALIAKPA